MAHWSLSFVTFILLSCLLSVTLAFAFILASLGPVSEPQFSLLLGCITPPGLPLGLVTSAMRWAWVSQFLHLSVGLAYSIVGTK